MSYASNTFITSGANEQNFTITWTAPYYMDTSHVSAEVNGVSWVVENVNGTTVTLETGIPASATVVISRTTDISDNEVNFLPGSAFRAQDVNADFDQLLFAIQENRDNVDDLEDKVDGLEDAIDETVLWISVANTLELNNVDTTNFTGGESYQILDSTNVDGSVVGPPVNNPAPNPVINGLPTSAQWDDELITRVRWNGSSWDFRVYVAKDPDGRYLNDGEVDLAVTTTATTNVITNTAGDDATLVGATASAAGLMVAADKTKLDGIATGAEVNVQSDWNETDSSSDAFIQNKPNIPANTDTTYTLPIGLASDTATITLTGSDGSTDPISLIAGTNCSFSLSGDELTINATDTDTDAQNLSYTAAVNSGSVDISGGGTSATIPLADGTNAGLFTAAEKTKLSGIAAGAEVNVQADWNEADTASDAYIQNKPNIPANTDTTYTLPIDLTGDTATITLTGSDSSTDPVSLTAGNNISFALSGDELTIAANIPADVNTTYTLSGNGGTNIRLAGSDGTNNDITLQGTGATTVTRAGNTFTINSTNDGSSQWTDTAGGIYYNGGDVGIGVTSPSEKLHVRGGDIVVGQSSGSNTGNRNYVKFGRDGAPKAAIGFYNNTSNGRGVITFMNSDADDGTSFQTSDEAMRITRTGNVGIGATTVNSRLHVATPAGSDCRIIVNEGTTSNPLVLEQTSTQSLIGTNASHPLVIRGQNTTDNNTSPIQFKTRTYERMRIQPGGNVGIGHQDPTATLHVASNNSINAFRLSHTDDLSSYNAFGRDNGGNLRIYDASDERIRLLSDGNINIIEGITFGTRTSVMSDYDSGTFVPAVVASGGGLTVNLSTKQGRYTKIGNRVLFEILISVSSVSGSGSGNLRITGMPFASINTQSSMTSSGGIGYCTNWPNTTYGGPSHWRMRPGVTTMDLYRQAVNSTGSGYVLGGMTTLNWQAVQATSTIRLSGNYRAA